MSVIYTNPNQPLYLAIDQGGHASRAMVYTKEGELVAQADREIVISRPQSEWVEQDADEIEKSIRDVLSDIAKLLGNASQDIAAAGLATQRSNVVCWDKETGKSLSPAISWQDRRASDWMQQFQIHASRIREITGLLPTAHYGVSKLHWCLENLPAVQEAHDNSSLAWGPLSSFLLFRLLKGRPLLVDPVNASRTLLWDIEQRAWSGELSALFGVASNYLPQCVASRYEFGELPVGESTVPLTVCTGDQSAALHAFGHVKPGTAYVNIGTGAFLQCIAKELSVLPKRLLCSVVWADAKNVNYVAEATINGAGSALHLVACELGVSSQEVKKNLPVWLNEKVNIPLYLNGVSGLGTPFWVPGFDSKFIGEAEPGKKLVAVIESIVFLLQVNVQELRNNKIEINCVVVSGGLSVLDGLCQRIADLSGIPVMRPLQTEATAKGLAFLVSGSEQAWTIGENDQFQPGVNSELSARYQRWRNEFERELVDG